MNDSLAYLQLAGLVLGIMGTFFMARGYLAKMIWYQVPWILFKVFWRRDTMAGVRALSELNQDDAVWVLRGLFLIAVSFILQLLSHLF
jgi:hypothetical protein